jgi:tetraacyldisaccharide-1-P 4'-kinase
MPNSLTPPASRRRADLIAAAVTFTGGKGKTPLVVTFNANATPAQVQALVRSLTFKTTAASLVKRKVQFTLTDGDGGTSVAVKKIVTVVN